ncbi:thermonuclease family protein [Candidatus Thioglobus sp.]|jgi:endonuclease YncB( thermonuclease family)|uniref:thermonuclease family protein n=1 Tax=Candidatus Thioglobus sp. TaxID=2026721 RepID=UPI001DB93274|nr:thermonuclease family protein [Candidatus Thioglobus sp.]MBT3277282.1 thermonuclease family protein [Candidatus Thioglobus sp.]MBT3446955.1 thermonuclease family protein [Candidatus Thioglobus sp.]MBT3744705.1 thermonuclease family protein [Candidatus Thioglobus sp.]MBT4001150.1 thermonuclease family protein [Candidatus Thioglobus sp.]MBT4181239.1 thermonuclease family protein [Candidatus Thioglobus sp.]
MKLFVFALFVSFRALANVGDFSLHSDQSLYIVDGDSVSLQMRLADIDTPEIKQKCREHVNRVIDCGRLSKRYLQRLLKSLPGEIAIKPIGIDHYQRILVRIYKGNTNIGKLMVESGMAFSYKDAYQQEEDLAKAEKLGFWGFYTPPIEPYKWRKLNRH